MFTRIYTGIILSVLLAALLSYALYAYSYQQRRAAYEAAALNGSMDLIADAIERLQPENRKRYLEIAASLLGADINTVINPGLEVLQASALESGGAAIQRRFPIDDSSLIELTIKELTEQQFRGNALLIASEISRNGNNRLDAQLLGYSRFPLSLRAAEDIQLDAQQASRLRKQSVVVAYQGAEFNIYTPIGDDLVLVLGPVPQWEALPLSIALGMLLITGFVIVTMSYVLVHQLEKRLISITDQVNRFGEGELESRAPDLGPDQIGTLARQFNNMARQIRDLLQSQREIMQAVSHELRTPISRIRFRVEMIEETGLIDSAKTSGIRRDIRQLEHLVDEVLTHHKLAHQPQLEKSDIELLSIADEVVANIRMLYPDIQIGVECPNGLRLHCHPPSIHRLLQNLVGNACKYASTSVTVGAETSANPSLIKLHVDDDGPGVPEEERPKLFEAFYRTDNSRNQKTGGYGLGLAIVDRIARLHQATVSVAASEAGGARFTVSFPLQSKPVDANSGVPVP